MANSNSRQTNAYVCLAVTFFAAIMTMVLRLTARRMTRVPLWWDDYLAIVSFAFAVVWLGLIIWWLHEGLGLHLNEIHKPAEDIQETSRLILWNVEIFYAFSLAFAKLSILAFYWRMFKTSNLKLPIQILGVSAIIWLTIRTFMAIFHCVPVQGFWDISIKATCNIDDSRFFFGTVLAHLIIDVAILILPVMQIRKLQLPVFKKAAIIAMFMFGIFVCIASIVVLNESLKYDTKSPEIPWNITPIIIWATAEVNLAIVSACLPMLRPIYAFIRRTPLSHGSSDGTYLGNKSSSAGAVKLTTITTVKRKNGKTSPDSDGDSTYKLQGSSLGGQREGSIGSAENSEYLGHADSQDKILQGPSTVIITGQAMDTDQKQREEDVERWAGIGGIMVTKDVGVRVSRTK